MITISKTIKSMQHFFESTAKARVNSTLLTMGQEWVEDKGYSYAALRVGVSAWPWRQSPEEVASEREIKRVIGELKSYTDRELRELSIARSDIETAVRHGRPDFENDLNQQAA